MKIEDIALLISATLIALMAGFFFSYSISVMWGLGKLGDKEFLSGMQSINKEVQNTLFFIGFFGPLLMLPVTAFLHYDNNRTKFIILLIATAYYLIGVFGVTVFGNVPLNNQLERFDFSIATDATMKHMRSIFEKRWNFLNNIRTVSALFSLIFILSACVMAKGK